MENNKKPIGFIDSGIGGYNILNEVKNILPNEDYIYFSDNLNNPYGEKTDEEIFELVKKCCDFLISHNCKMIVFACNTATSVCIEKIRSIYNIPIIGTVPALKVAIDYNKNQNILVMATPATIRSEKFLDIYNKYYTPNIILLPCEGLANLIENSKIEEIDIYLENKLKLYENIDTVVLGCTHYNYITKNIKKIINAQFVDGNIGISKQIKKVLKEKELLNDSTNIGTLKEFSTIDLFKS